MSTVLPEAAHPTAPDAEVDLTAGRGLVDGLPTPRPLIEQVPASLQEDEFCGRLLAAFDEVLAPVFNTLDCFDAYLDPALAPEDFIDWLAGWVGLDVDETWTVERRRRLILEAVGLYRFRGSIASLVSHVELYSGVTPTVEDNGGCSWSQNAGSVLPGTSRPYLKVRLQVDDDADIRRGTLARIIDANRPAHVPFELELVAGGTEVQAAGDTGEHGAVGAPGAVALPGSEFIELAPQTPGDTEQLEAPADSRIDDEEATD